MDTVSDEERDAIRSYLQRCEVRLSTLHRVATAFIGGSGLLLLFPVFFKDSVTTVIDMMLVNIAIETDTLLSALLYLTLGYPLVLSLLIPLYGVYLLLKDITHFYFNLYVPGHVDRLLNPAFSISGITFSPDESPRIKEEVLQYEYLPNNINYTIPFSAGRREFYFDTLIDQTDSTILPRSRNINYLKSLGISDVPATNHMSAAFGLARTIDRTLVEEVAIAEMTLTRNILYLRRLVLRYFKTLLMFIWTTVIYFAMLPLLKHFTVFPVLSVGYLIWAIGTVPIMQQPIHWIYKHRYNNEEDHHIDPQLQMMETVLRRFCQLAILLSIIALVLTMVQAGWLD